MIALSASARYMAPLSRFTYPSFLARREAIVLLPAPAGPSMAMISLRCEVVFIAELEIVHTRRFQFASAIPRQGQWPNSRFATRPHATMGWPLVHVKPKPCGRETRPF